MFSCGLLYVSLPSLMYLLWIISFLSFTLLYSFSIHDESHRRTRQTATRGKFIHRHFKAGRVKQNVQTTGDDLPDGPQSSWTRGSRPAMPTTPLSRATSTLLRSRLPSRSTGLGPLERWTEPDPESDSPLLDSSSRPTPRRDRPPTRRRRS
jgi:hypothetical protein